MREPEIVDYLFFHFHQLLRSIVLNGEYIPTCTVRHGTFCSIDKRFVPVPATEVTKAFGPGCFIVPIERRVPVTQISYDCGD